MSAAARARFASHQWDCPTDIMPVQFSAGLRPRAPTGRSPSASRNCCQFKELLPAVAPHCGSHKEIKRLDHTMEPRSALTTDGWSATARRLHRANWQGLKELVLAPISSRD